MNDAPRPTTLTLRSIVLGLLGGLGICLLLPYNDNAMQNTPLVGNNLPIGVMMLLFLFVTLVNGPLHRWRPRSAFTSFELATSFTLMLVMCAVPSTGLVRFLLPNLATPFYHAIDNTGYRDVITRLGVASWVFPSFEGKTPAEWLGDPLATGFYYRWMQTDRAPYAAWVVPFVSWGIFVGALFWSLLCMVCIVMRQWRDNEHLAFPLASIQLALIESPARGHWLNRVLRARSFWIAFGAVLLLHLNNGLSTYLPKNVVPISRGFNFLNLLNDQPWSFTDTGLREQTIYFAMIGITFFLSGPVAFSLWFFVIIMQVYKMAIGMQSGDSALPGINDQRHGAAIAIFLSLVWLGRRHWLMVIKQAIRGPRAGEPRGNYMSYRSAAWGIVGAAVVMVAWLMAAGMTFLGGVNVVLVLMIAFVLITRVIAETGMIHGAMPVSILKPLELAAFYGGAKAPLDTFYLSSTMQATLYDYREILPVYASHGVRCLDETKPDALAPEQERRIGRRIIGLICVALVLAYASSFWASLWTHYNYAVTLDIGQKSPIDDFGVQGNPRWQILDPSVTHENGSHAVNYDRAGNLTLGFGVTALLSFLRLRFTWWPLHPVGYLIYGTFPSMRMWFSIFLGWLLKLVVLRFGSASFYERCKPFFIGLIMGECAAAGVWLVVSIVLHLCGVPYRSVQVLPA